LAVVPPQEPIYVIDNPVFSEPPVSRFDRFWIRTDYVFAWADRASLPATWTNPATGTTVTVPSAPHSSVQDGFYLEGGFWLDAARTHGFDASYFTLYDTYCQLDPTPVGTFAGVFPNAVVQVESWVDSADVNYRHPLYERDSLRIDGLLGYRFFGLTERAWVDTVMPGAADEVFFFHDRGSAWTQFHGGQLGLALSWQGDRWAFGATGKVALGASFTSASLAGASAAALQGRTIDFGTTSGFAVVPAASYDVSWRFWGPHRLTFGYQFQYLSRAARAADVFNALAVPSQSPVSPTGRYWAQGLTLGLEFRF
jgi:hypothetical protein